MGGGDRPLWSITNSSAQKTQFSCLNREGKYRQSAAGVLSGMLRPHQTLLDHWVLSKFIGNNRVVKKLLPNGGRPSRVLMQVQFHEVGKTAEEYIQIESELHSTDAGDRSGQNEKPEVHVWVFVRIEYYARYLRLTFSRSMNTTMVQSCNRKVSKVVKTG